MPKIKTHNNFKKLVFTRIMGPDGDRWEGPRCIWIYFIGGKWFSHELYINPIEMCLDPSGNKAEYNSYRKAMGTVSSKYLKASIVVTPKTVKDLFNWWITNKHQVNIQIKYDLSYRARKADDENMVYS